MSIADTYFIDAANKIITAGFSDKDYNTRTKWEDDTPAYTKKIFSYIAEYDLQKEFPILTLRKIGIKSLAKELIWMWLKKSNNINEFDLNIWDSWADEKGSIGKTYGYQLGKKYIYPEGEVDQVDHLLYTLKNNPMDRRMIVSMWNPEDLHEMNLPPCVHETLWDVSGEYLNMTLVQRSGDMLAAAGPGSWDCAQHALLLCIIAQVNGLKPGKFVHIVNNLHIYDRHIPIVENLIKQPTYSAPKIIINPDLKDFYSFTENDVIIENYENNGNIGRFEVAI